MRNDSTVFVGLDVHQKSIVAAYAVDAGETEIWVRSVSLPVRSGSVCKRMQGKERVRFVYEAGPCGYAAYRYLTAKGFDCTVARPR